MCRDLLDVESISAFQETTRSNVQGFPYLGMRDSERELVRE